MHSFLLPTIFTTCLVLLLVCAVIEASRRKRKGDWGFVCLPGFNLWMGSVGAVFMVLVMWLLAGNGLPILLSLVPALFAALGMLLVLVWINCTLCYDDRGFMQTTLLGRKHAYNYNQLTDCRRDTDYSDMLLYIGKKRLRIDRTSCGLTSFQNTILEKRPDLD